MRIVNRTEFLALPAGTVFSKWQPCWFDDMCIKGETWAHCNDFTYQAIASAVETKERQDLYDALFGVDGCPAQARMDFECMGRDGRFDADQMFAVWDAIDTMQLIKRLLDAVADTFKEQV